MSNEKYEITDIAHEQYPFLHRIRAVQDVGGKVKAGDLGGFVESEQNLSFAPDDDAWLFDDAIAAGEAVVEQDALLFGNATTCGNAMITGSAVLRDNARAEDNAYVRGAVLTHRARVSGNGMVIPSPAEDAVPLLTDDCSVYGVVQGNIRLGGHEVVSSGETLRHESPDKLLIGDNGRSVLRDAARDGLHPCRQRQQPVPSKSVKNKRGMDR